LFGEKMLRLIRRASRWGWVGASGCILVIVGLIVVEIGLRSLTGRSTFITEEFSGYLLAWFAFLGMAETLRTDGHVRVSIVISRLGGRARAVQEVLANALGAAVFLYLAFYMGLVFYSSWEMKVQSMHISQTPLFIPQIVPFLGSILMAMQFFVQLVENAGRVLRPGGG
jgi:TRAP-type transport system small permease protein